MKWLALLALALSAPAHAQDTYSSLVTAGMVQQQTVTLNSSGDATWTFVTPFLNPPIVAHFPKQMDPSNPLICNYTSVTTTAVSIHCWRTTLAGLLTNLFGGSVTGGEVTIIARTV
ncbi:hypothetical protein [Sphingobium olei]|uniref:Uncharacterized protein n=1 Tax=Sphingobium olei TaxID=420955 RepID=A0ABW3P058_9SPHN